MARIPDGRSCPRGHRAMARGLPRGATALPYGSLIHCSPSVPWRICPEPGGLSAVASQPRRDGPQAPVGNAWVEGRRQPQARRPRASGPPRRCPEGVKIGIVRVWLRLALFLLRHPPSSCPSALRYWPRGPPALGGASARRYSTNDDLPTHARRRARRPTRPNSQISHKINIRCHCLF